MNTPLCEQGSPCPHYDIVVVGAGIAGLYMTRELLKKYPKMHIALLERYKGLGGRTYSYSPPGFEGIQWEMGAGRIHKDHTLVLGLLKDYGLTWVHIGTEVGYIHKNGDPLVANPFETLYIPTVFDPLHCLSADTLASHTIEELMNKVYGLQKTADILATFPYRAEVTTLRADLGLQSFSSGGEMGSYAGYGVVAEGFGELVKRMREDVEKRGATILQRHQLLNFKKGVGNAVDLEIQFGYDPPKPGGTIQLRAEKAVVLALHKDAVAELPAMADWKVLQHLQTKPLLRTYAIFPTVSGKSWFSGMPKVVTSERPRFILPMDAGRGVIMISYTDADDTEFYAKVQEKGGDKALEKVILDDVRKLLPRTRIPKPLFFRSHLWKTGATYWLPGLYNPVLESNKAVHPKPTEFPSVWLCGESWSLRQAWVEGALEHANECLRKIKV
jgi:hypothetical protein